jgi:hypothetical protein
VVDGQPRKIIHWCCVTKTNDQFRGNQKLGVTWSFPLWPMTKVCFRTNEMTCTYYLTTETSKYRCRPILAPASIWDDRAEYTAIRINERPKNTSRQLSTSKRKDVEGRSGAATSDLLLLVLIKKSYAWGKKQLHRNKARNYES